MSELVASVSLRYIAGDDVLLEFAVTDEDGDAAIIAGDTVHFAVARKVGQEPVLSTDDGNVTASLTNPSGGVFQVAIDDADTAGLLGTYAWQCALEDVSGNVATVARGYITFAARA